MIGKSVLIVISALFVMQSVRCELKTTKYNTTTYVTCSLENASNEKLIECPVNSKCIDLIKVNGTEARGFCMCKKELVLNPNFNSSDNYCIERNSSHSTSTSTTTTTTTVAAPTTTAATIKTTAKAPSSSSLKPTSAPTTTTAAPKVTSTEKPNSSSEEKKEPIPEPRKGFFGLILVPVMIVLAFIGAVFAIRKYDVIERTHSYIRNRGVQQHQTRYDGLENDFDDDPLLI